MSCPICNKDNHSGNRFPNDICSWSCYSVYSKIKNKPNTECAICSKMYYIKPYLKKRVKHGNTCCIECSKILKSRYMNQDGNHQFGLKGHLNSSYIGVDRINQYGYNMKYLPNHPKSDKNGRYREHRYVIELNYEKFDKYFFEIIDDMYVLKDDYDVHHINGIKNDNRFDNLLIMTRSEHTTLHNTLRYSGVK